MSNLLKTLHQIFKKNICTKISTENFMNFLFNPIGDLEGDIGNFFPSTRELLSIYNQKQELSVQCRFFLSSIKIRPFKTFVSNYTSQEFHTIESILLKDFSELYNSLLHRSKEQLSFSDNINTLFNALIEQHMLDDLILYHRYPFQKMKTVPCKPFFLHPDTEIVIDKLLKNRILFLYGFPGTGKTELAKEIQRRWTDNKYGEDVTCIDYRNSLTDTLASIKYKTKSNFIGSLSAKEKAYLLYGKDRKSLLVIEDMDISASDLIDHYLYLKETACCILVTVNKEHVPDTIPSHSLGALEYMDLKTLFLKDDATSLPDNICRPYFNLLNYHTLTIKLMGMAIRSGHLDAAKVISQYTENSFNYSQLPPVKYSKERQRLLRHLETLLMDTDFITLEERDSLRLLSLFRGKKIDISFMSKCIPELSANRICSLIEKGVLSEEKNCIYMHPIVSDIIYDTIELKSILAENVSHRTPSNMPSLLPMIKELTNTLDNIWDYHYPVEYLIESTHAFFCSLKDRIRFTSNAGQQTLSSEGRYWLEFCITCIHFYQEYGDTVYADELLTSILDSYKEAPLPDILKFEKKFSEIISDWQKNYLSLNQVETFFNEIIQYVQKEKNINNLLSVCLSSLLYDMIRYYLDRMILCIKRYPGQQIYIDTFRKGYQLLNCVLSKSSLSEIQIRYILSSYFIWAEPLSIDTISYAEGLLSLASNAPSQLRILCDIVYIEGILLPFHPENLTLADRMKNHYKVLTDLYNKCQNFPAYIKQSRNIADLIYAECFSDNFFAHYVKSQMMKKERLAIRVKEDIIHP